LPREADELVHMLRRFIGREFEAERSEIGCHDRFEFSGRLRPRDPCDKNERQQAQ